MPHQIPIRKRFLPIAFVLVFGFFAASCIQGSKPIESDPVLQTHPVTTRQPIPTTRGPLSRNTAVPVVPASPTLTSTPPKATSLPNPTPFVCRQRKGSIQQDQVSTDLLRYPIDFRVYLPPCYEQEPDRRYPVLYLIHGQSYNDDQWDRLGADEAADALIYSGEASPFIIVMPRYRIWYQPDEHNFGLAMVETLIPLIDASFRTIPDRQKRAIGGLSMGAAWALHLGLSQWELFGAIGLHSLALFSIDSPRIPGWLDSIPTEQLPRIFIDIGDRDSKALIDSTIWFEETLTRKNIPHEWYLFPGYHEEKYWQEHTVQYLRWYSRDW